MMQFHIEPQADDASRIVGQDIHTQAHLDLPIGKDKLLTLIAEGIASDEPSMARECVSVIPKPEHLKVTTNKGAADIPWRNVVTILLEGAA